MNRSEPLLGALVSSDETQTLARLQSQLVERAADRGLLQVAYRTLDSPVGTLLLAATPIGLVRVAYQSEDHDKVLATLANRVSPRVLFAPAHLDAAAREIDEYFGRRRRNFELPLDFRLAHGFRRNVLDFLLGIGYGTTASYATIATAAGSPQAVRAVGSACAANPLPLIVPCHRILRSDGTLGGYVGGLDAKRTLLALEAVKIEC